MYNTIAERTDHDRHSVQQRDNVVPKPIPLQYGRYYHIYNRGNNRENLFVEERNYRYFLRLYARHIEPIAETYAYCLLRNHFHVLVKIKDEENLRGLKPPSQHFSNPFNAYARAFNNAYERTGTLFERPFERIEVTSDAHFTLLVTYIHQNPQLHRFVTDFRDWIYSSYHADLSDKPARVKRQDVLAWFDGAENLETAHCKAAGAHALGVLTLEDLL